MLNTFLRRMDTWLLGVVLLAAGANASATTADDSPGLASTSSVRTGDENPFVNGQNGQATVSYPFELPPGRDGFTPSLTLSYSSSGGDSWVGYGFQLAVPTIRRETRNGRPDYTCGGTTGAAMCFVVESGGAVTPLIRNRPKVAVLSGRAA